jgi:hypothetical protein
MTKKRRPNCWEFKQCGREPGGVRAEQLGICPAATAPEFSGVNRGENAGRYCWRVAGTFCEGKVEGSFAGGLMSCSLCEFYKSVQDTERGNLQL